MTPSGGAGTVGESVARLHDRELSTATATFLRDHHPDGVLWLALARSPLAHAELEGFVNLDAVRALPGVVAVLTADDLPQDSDMVPPLVRDGVPMRATRRPLLARGRVRFLGEPVAAVLAETLEAAWDGAAAIETRLRPLPAVTDPVEATTDRVRLYAPESNVLFTESEGWDEVTDALAQCPTTIEREFVVGRYNPAPLETRGAIAEHDGDQLLVTCSTQAPAQLQKAIMASTGLRDTDVHVVASRVGGGFGQKAHAHPEEVLVAICARDTGRPVKWLESRRENLTAANHARDQVVRCAAGCDADGRLRVLRCDVLSDTGAYGVWPHGHLLEALGTVVAMPGAYDLESFGYRTRAVATNKCPGGAYRGVGFAVATFVRERMVEILSRKLGEDRIDFRVRSCGDWCAPRTTPTGLELRGDFGTVIARVAAEVGEAPADPSPGEDGEVLTGTGYALYAEPVSPGAIVFSGRGMAGIVGYDDVRVRLAGDGRFAVATSSPPIGQGTETTFAQVVAQAIGCPLDRVYVEPSSTHGGMDGTGTFASRSAASVAVACERAATRLRSALLQATAAHLGLAPDEVRIDHHGVSASTRAGSVSSFAELARILPREVLSVTERTDPGWGGVAYGAHACAVKVHTATGRVDIERFVVVEDCGEMINPGIVFNQALGGVAQATGMSLLERLEYDADGRPSSTGFADYLVPRAPDVPDIRLVHHRSAATAGMRLGAGEGGAVAAAAALANAVSDALGAEVNAMPFDPAEVWQICRERRVATLG